MPDEVCLEFAQYALHEDNVPSAVTTRLSGGKTIFKLTMERPGGTPDTVKLILTFTDGQSNETVTLSADYDGSGFGTITVT